MQMCAEVGSFAQDRNTGLLMIIVKYHRNYSTYHRFRSDEKYTAPSTARELSAAGRVIVRLVRYTQIKAKYSLG